MLIYQYISYVSRVPGHSIASTPHCSLFSFVRSFSASCCLGCQLSRAWMTGLINNENHTQKRSVPCRRTKRVEKKKTLNEIRQMRQRHFKCLQIMISLICKCRNRLRVCERASGSSMNRRMHLCVPFLLLHFFLLNFGHTEMTAPMTTLSFE